MPTAHQPHSSLKPGQIRSGERHVSRRSKTTLRTLTTILIVAIAAGCFARHDHEHSWPAEIYIRLPNKEIIAAEVSATWPAIKRGLMGRPSLSFNEGMLFVYPDAARHPHWMHQCLVPLDIVWLTNDKRVLEIVHRAQPCSHVPCPSYGRNNSSRFVLELAMGRAERSVLRVGDGLEFPIIAISSVEPLSTSVASRPLPSATSERAFGRTPLLPNQAPSRDSHLRPALALRTIQSLHSVPMLGTDCACMRSNSRKRYSQFARPFRPRCVGHCFGLNSRALGVCRASASRPCRALLVPVPPFWSPPEM